MLEILLNSDSRAPLPFEDDHPGPTTTIHGNRNLGYFGQTTEDELITAAALATLGGVTVGNVSAYYAAAGWLKFVKGGKILYVAKRQMRSAISWTQINSAAAIMGKNVTIKGRVYKLRVLTGGNGKPSSGAGGEWDELIYKVAANSPSQIKWDSLTGADLSGGTGQLNNWCQETSRTNAALRVMRRITGSTGDVTAYLEGAAGTANTNAYCWRPVLESMD